MTSGDFWALERLTDHAVQQQLSELLVSGARTEARILAHLAVIEDRRLHLSSGCSSMFEYCVQRLGLSENEAFHRLTAARLARRFPLIFRLIEERRIHLTGVCLLRDYLSEDNHAELLREASGKTKRQVLELLARRHPRPDVRSTLRKLPAPAPALVAPAPAPALVAPAPALVAIEPAPAPRDHASPRSQAQLTPTSVDRYRLQLNVSAAMREKLELARALLRHAVPDGDLSMVVERAIDELLARLKQKRFGSTSSQRAETRRRPKESEKTKGTHRREHISHRTRREVAERDGLRCTFESEDGHRCSSRAFLELHHVQPWARDGDSSTENLELRCSAHNRLQAERDFGRQTIERKVREKRCSRSEGR